MTWRPNPITFGNAAQWVSAFAAIITMIVAIYGVSAASPWFQNRRLTNENETLRVQVQDATTQVASLQMQTASLESGVRDKAKELQKLTSSLLCAQVQGAVRVMAVKAFPRGGRTNIGGENIRTVMNEVEMVTNRLRIDEATKARVLDVWRPLAQKYAQAGGQPVTVSEFAYELWAACDRVALGGQIQ